MLSRIWQIGNNIFEKYQPSEFNLYLPLITPPPTLLIKYGLGKQEKKSLAPVNEVPRIGLTQGPYMGTFPEMD